MKKNTLKTLIQEMRDQCIVFFICAKLRVLHVLGKKAIVFIPTPTHGNLGDQAIVYAQYVFFQSIGLGKRIVEIHRYCYERWKERLGNAIDSQDIIVIDGGGNMGTLWIEEERIMQDIAIRFRNNPVFVFPQTASYAEDDDGQKELIRSRIAYSMNERFMVFARDNNTVKILQTLMPEVRCMYTPDMVMLIGHAQTLQPRNGVAFCLRNDSERILTENQCASLKSKFESNGICTWDLSTVVPGAVWKYQRKRKLQKKWRELSGAQLVITDRLHGMVFSAITGTPCIAMDNVSHKVYGAYQWLSYLPYLRFCRSIDEVRGTAEELMALPPQKYDLTPLIPYYDEMKRIMKNAL